MSETLLFETELVEQNKRIQMTGQAPDILLIESNQHKYCLLQ